MYVGCCDVTAPALFACSQLPAPSVQKLPLAYFSKKKKTNQNFDCVPKCVCECPGDAAVDSLG